MNRHAFLTHFKMRVPTATRVPSWFLIAMSPVDRRRSMSIALMRYSTVTVDYRIGAIDIARRRSTGDITIKNQDGTLVAVGTHILKWVKNAAA